MSKNRLIPKLRFPEFVNCGEWRSKLISKIGKTVNGLSGKRGSDFGNGNPYVQYKQVFDKSFIDFSECGKVEVAEDEKQNQLQLGDILFTTSSETPDEIGFSSVVINQPKKSTYLNSFCFILRPFDLKEIEPNFSRYLFRSPIYRKSVSTIAQGSTRYNLSKKAFLKLQIPIPQPQEQQKIASCLSSLDEVIEAHSKKLQLLKDHKKGLMQNLFPQEGEKVPKLRFPEFVNGGEWEEKTFDNIYDFKVTNSFSRALLNYEKGKVKNIHYGDIHTKFNTLFDIDKEDVPFVNSDVLIGNINEENYCLVGDIIFADASEDVKDIGKSIEIINLGSQKLLAGLHTLLARQKNNDLVFGYGGYLFKSEWVRKQIRKESQGAKVLGISKTRIKKIFISFPKNKQEQQKIASCLSALDELITAQTEKIEQLQQHKKGLIQGLFPKMES